MFKYLKYTLLVIVALVGFGLAKSSAFAYTTSFNSLSNDLDTVKVSNYTLNPGCSTCWSSSVNASPGDVVSVQIYYRNVGGVNVLGSQTATDTKVRINSAPGGNVGSWNVTGGVWSSNAPFDGGSASIYINGTPQTITYIPGSTKWYADHNFISPYPIGFGQNGSEINTGAGLTLGNILAPSTCGGYPSVQFCHQGTVVARFQISNNQQIVYACSDNLDNDNDNLIDFPQDPGCTSATDNDEYNFVSPVYACSDGIDNDNDNYTDYPQDVGCSSATDNDEYNSIGVQTLVVTTNPATSISPTTATLNGYVYPGGLTVTSRYFIYGTAQNNLNLTKTIYGNITQSGPFSAYVSALSSGTTYYYRACAVNSTGSVCGKTVSFNTTQSQVYACSDNIDNDNDNLTDFPQDPGCSSATDNDEYNVVLTYACSDNIDNDFDGLVDMNDPGCYGPTDTSEYNQNQVYQCSDNYDNDFDGLVDMNDPGCTSPTDNDEFNQQNSTLNVTTNQATGVTSTGATLNGYYTAGNILVNNYFFKYGTSYNSLNQTTPSQYPNNYSGYMTMYLNGLIPNMTYYFQACATTAQTGVVCGQVLNFYTPNTPLPNPTDYMNITTSIATSVGYGAAMLNGIISGSYCSSSSATPKVWFEYGETSNLGYTTTQETSNSAFAISIHNLKPSTVYYFRAVGQNNCGVYKGAIRSFSTNSKGNGGGGGVVIVNNNIISGSSCMYMKISSDFESLHVGDTNTYTIDYKNNCKSVVRDAMIVVEIPFELRFERSSMGIFADSSHQLNIPIGTLIAKDSGSIVYQATPMQEALKRDTLITTAHMTYAYGNGDFTDDVLSYVVEHVLNANGQGSSNYDDDLSPDKKGFLPATLIGWLLLIFAVILLVAVIKKTRD